MQKTNVHTSHHIRGLRPVLEAMASLGIGAEQCLANSGVRPTDLDQAETELSVEQEFRVYRNILQLSKDPLLGLKLGRQYTLESYGILGYAMLSAATMAEALAIAADFHVLTFSHFALSQFSQGELAGIAFSQQYPLPEELLGIYSDRDSQAAVISLSATCHHQAQPRLIRLMHSGGGNKPAYQEFFGCPVEFNHHRNEVLFDQALLSQPLPQRDAQSSSYCRQQCQHLVNTLSAKGSFIDKVRNIIVATPSRFPSIENVASDLGTSARSLRRKLAQENSGYQKLLNEIRFEMAKNYLQTSMPIEQIAERLGYSEAANFSHAFKRFCQKTPSQYRDLLGIPA